MAIAAHTPGGYGGVSQSVGQEFHSKDRGKYGAMTKNGKKKKKKHHGFGRLAGE